MNRNVYGTGLLKIMLSRGCHSCENDEFRKGYFLTFLMKHVFRVISERMVIKTSALNQDLDC